MLVAEVVSKVRKSPSLLFSGPDEEDDFEEIDDEDYSEYTEPEFEDEEEYDDDDDHYHDDEFDDQADMF